MASISNYVTVNIVQTAQSQVTTENFGLPLIIGPSNRFTNSDIVRSYSTLSAMTADGFLPGDPEYIHANALLAQSPAVPSFLVGNFTATTDEVDTITVNTVTSGHDYVFDLNGTVVSYTAQSSDAQQDILNGLNAAMISAFPTAIASGVVTGSAGTAVLTLTAVTPGDSLSFSSIDSELTHATTTQNHSIVSDIEAIQQVNDAWYGLICTSKVANDILEIAEYIETTEKLYVTVSSDAAILTSATSDVASQLKAAKYTKTALIYSGNAALGPDAAWMGVMFPTVPGSSNWNYKTLVGITTDNLSATQVGNVTSKNANVYITAGGVNITNVGTCASGEYIDIAVLVAFLTVEIQASVFGTLANAQKIPYTNAGITTLESGVGAVLQEAQNNGGIVPGWTITAPDVSTITLAEKQARSLPSIVFSAEFAGAINTAGVTGYISV